MTRGIRIAKKPKTCKIRIKPSNLGSAELTRIFMKTAKANMAQESKVPCQSLGSKLLSFKEVRPKIMFPVRSALEVTEPCQPPTVSIPVR
jgi:hypothetical protein